MAGAGGGEGVPGCGRPSPGLAWLGQRWRKGFDSGAGPPYTLPAPGLGSCRQVTDSV